MDPSTSESGVAGFWQEDLNLGGSHASKTVSPSPLSFNSFQRTGTSSVSNGACASTCICVACVGTRTHNSTNCVPLAMEVD